MIIGHRGAAGIEPENTIASINAAVEAGVDMIEFDIRVTKDNQLVVFHDPNLLRIVGSNKNVANLTLAELTTLKTKNGLPIPSFDQAMQAAGTTPVLLDCKGKGWVEILHQALQNYHGPTPAVTVIDTKEMFRFYQLRPDIKTYVSEITKPFEAIYKARLLGFTGISLNFWVMNPLAYFYAKRNNLHCMIFTVDHLFIARFLRLFYPQADIITNCPNKLRPLSRHPTETAKD